MFNKRFFVLLVTITIFLHTESNYAEETSTSEGHNHFLHANYKSIEWKLVDKGTIVTTNSGRKAKIKDDVATAIIDVDIINTSKVDLMLSPPILLLDENNRELCKVKVKPDEECSALSAAKTYGHTRIVELLKEYGAIE